MHPFLFQSSEYALPSYIFIISLTTVICLFWTQKKSAQEDMNPRIALDLAFALMAGGFIGGRLFHIFYEGFDYYINYPMDALRFWEGGFVFYGGWFGGLIASIVVAKMYKQPVLLWADFFAPILAFGYGFGRLACFLNGCCHGDYCDLPWAVEFTHEGLAEGPRHPTALYAMGWELLVTLPILLILAKKFKAGLGSIFFSWLALHGTGRILMESFRVDNRGDFIYGLSVSTWISIALILTSAIFFVQKARART